MENPINEIQLVKGRRGRPRKDEEAKPKLWESKEHIALYNKIYYAKNKKPIPSDEKIICPICKSLVGSKYMEKHQLTKYHLNYSEAPEKNI
jgi:hypothetical protein